MTIIHVRVFTRLCSWHSDRCLVLLPEFVTHELRHVSFIAWDVWKVTWLMSEYGSDFLFNLSVLGWSQVEVVITLSFELVVGQAGTSILVVID